MSHMKKMYKNILILICILTFGVMTSQEELTVSGTVSHQGMPLPGVNVIVVGTGNGTTTDFDGNYSLSGVPDNATLEFSYLGFETQEVPVNGRQEIPVTMEEGS